MATEELIVAPFQVPAPKSPVGVHLLSDVLRVPQPEDEHLQKEVHHQAGSDAPHCYKYLRMAEGLTLVSQFRNQREQW